MSTPKPWEQQWSVQADYAVLCEQRKVRARVYTDELSPDAAKEDAKLIAAAPDMARALLAVLPHEDEAGPKPPAHIRECLEWRQRNGLITECATGCQEVMAALRKAGVL